MTVAGKTWTGKLVTGSPKAAKTDADVCVLDSNIDSISLHDTAVRGYSRLCGERQGSILALNPPTGPIDLIFFHCLFKLLLNVSWLAHVPDSRSTSSLHARHRHKKPHSSSRRALLPLRSKSFSSPPRYVMHNSSPTSTSLLV